MSQKYICLLTSVFFTITSYLLFLYTVTFSLVAQIEFLTKRVQGSGMASSSSSRRLRICLLRSFFTSIRWLRDPFASTSRKLGGSPVEDSGVGVAADVEGYDDGGGVGKVVEFAASA